jgi:taurine--2-oxoglutarate transaminase
MTGDGRSLLERQKQHIFFSWSAQRHAQGLVIERAEGSRFWTADGREWVDFESQVFNANLGHGHPRVIAAVQAQAASLCVAHPAAVFEAKARVGELLSEVLPAPLDKHFLCLSGAEANENALKMARLVTGRQKVVSRYRSYHGASYGAMTLGGDPRRHALEPGIPGVVRVEDPYCYRCPWQTTPDVCARPCVDHVERIIDFEGPSNVAAVFVEAITGAAGGIIPPVDYLQRLRTLCDRHGILLVCDEVLTGFGRTGKWFAFEHSGIVPDMVTMGKGITGGYAPLGAVAVHRRIAEHFEDATLWAGLTSYGHPLGCAAAVAAIEAYRDEGWIDRAAALEPLMRQRLDALADRFEVVDGVRARGLYGGFELVRSRATREPIAPWNGQGAVMAPSGRLRRELEREALHVALRGNIVLVAPPLTIDEETLSEGFDRLGRALERWVITEGLG